MTRLSSLDGLNQTVGRPGYDPAAHGVGIVHLGLGAFHRAHQAVYTDDALAKGGGDWRIMGVSLRSRIVADQLNPQKGLYTLVIRGEGHPEFRIIGSIAGVLFAPDEDEELRAVLKAPETKIVSLTITEKGYGLDRETGGLDRSHPAIKADIGRDLNEATSAIGLIVGALDSRRKSGVAPFTVLACDNLSHNGKVTKRLVLEFASRFDTDLVAWIEHNVPFPSTMVDRITPASTEKTFADVQAALGFEDKGATETEPFTQWIVEDDFCAGRPDWEAGGALFVKDVTAYEQMKLGMLNGSHSMLAYSGFLAGHKYVRDVMGEGALAKLVRRHMDTAAKTLPAVPGIDLQAYADELIDRFANPTIAHETYQIAMDGTEKLPQRIFEPAMVAQVRGDDLAPFAFATAAWMAYARGRKSDGSAYALRDPREQEIADIVNLYGDNPQALADGLMALPGFVPQQLREDAGWQSLVIERLTTIMSEGMTAAISAEAQ